MKLETEHCAAEEEGEERKRERKELKETQRRERNTQKVCLKISSSVLLKYSARKSVLFTDTHRRADRRAVPITCYRYPFIGATFFV